MDAGLDGGHLAVRIGKGYQVRTRTGRAFGVGEISATYVDVAHVTVSNQDVLV